MLSFQFRKGEGEHLGDYVETRVLVDGEDLLRKIDDTALGVNPFAFFRQPELLGGGLFLLGVCACGTQGCGDHGIEVVREENRVAWVVCCRPSDAGEVIEFDWAYYQSTIASAASDTSWEMPGDTIQRLISQIDFSRYLDDIGDFHFDAAPFLENDGLIWVQFKDQMKHKVVKVPWSGGSPEDAVNAVVTYFEKLKL